MKNTIAIFGGSIFEEVKYEHDKYEIINNNYLKMMHAMYSVRNYSYSGLNMSKSKKILKNIIETEKLEMCIISLSENESSALDEFTYNLDIMLSMLKDHDVKVVLIANDNSAYHYNFQMKALANLYNCQYLSYLSNEKPVKAEEELVIA